MRMPKAVSTPLDMTVEPLPYMATLVPCEVNSRAMRSISLAGTEVICSYSSIVCSKALSSRNSSDERTLTPFTVPSKSVFAEGQSVLTVGSPVAASTTA